MEINIGKSARHCTATGRTFDHGEEVISLVRLHDQSYVREDYSRESWSETLVAGAVAVWTTMYHDPRIEEAKPPEVYSPLRQVFYEAVACGDRTELATAFLAAQLLRRQKVFRLLKEFDDEEGEARVALFADRIGDRLIEVRDPTLTYAELETGRRTLMERLNAIENPSQEQASDNGQLKQA